MNNSTFTTCMMRVWQGGCASNYLHCGNVTHERHGIHKVISLSLRHHPVSYLLVSFFLVVSFPKDTNSRSVLLGNKSVLAGVGNGATAPRPSRNIQHQLQPQPLHKCKQILLLLSYQCLLGMNRYSTSTQSDLKFVKKFTRPKISG